LNNIIIINQVLFKTTQSLTMIINMTFKMELTPITFPKSLQLSFGLYLIQGWCH
jgi:hypothetical protein